MSKVCLVIGAGDATGGAVARRFAREGYTVCVTRRSLDKLEPLLAQIRQAGGVAHGFGSDARKEEDVIALVEHIESDQLIHKLDEYLGFPKTDPHGDPIPNKDGILPELAYSHLSDIKAGKTCKLMGVAQDSAVFLQLLTKLNLSLGAKLAIQEINEFDRSIFVSINDAAPIFISHEVAKNILVKILA